MTHARRPKKASNNRINRRRKRPAIDFGALCGVQLFTAETGDLLVTPAISSRSACETTNKKGFLSEAFFV
jgi:hypothetical protein